MRFVRIGRTVFNTDLAEHLSGFGHEIILQGRDAERFVRWLERIGVEDWADKHKHDGSNREGAPWKQRLR